MAPHGRRPRQPRRHWTATIYTRANPLVEQILASRAHWSMSGRTVMLRIVGRRTGRRYSIAVGYASHDENTIDVLVSDAANRTWWRNFTDAGPVGVLLRGVERTGVATAHRAPSADFRKVANRAIPKILGRRGARTFFALPDFDPRVGLTDDQMERLAGFAVAVEIALDPVG